MKRTATEMQGGKDKLEEVEGNEDDIAEDLFNYIDNEQEGEGSNSVQEYKEGDYESSKFSFTLTSKGINLIKLCVQRKMKTSQDADCLEFQVDVHGIRLFSDPLFTTVYHHMTMSKRGEYFDHYEPPTSKVPTQLTLNIVDLLQALDIAEHKMEAWYNKDGNLQWKGTHSSGTLMAFPSNRVDLPVNVLNLEYPPAIPIHPNVFEKMLKHLKKTLNIVLHLDCEKKCIRISEQTEQGSSTSMQEIDLKPAVIQEYQQVAGMDMVHVKKFFDPASARIMHNKTVEMCKESKSNILISFPPEDGDKLKISLPLAEGVTFQMFLDDKGEDA